MAKFKLTIKEAVSGNVVKEVDFDEQIQADAKNRFYDILLEEAANQVDGEYTGELSRWMPAKEQWDEVRAPVISCEVIDGKSVLTVRRAVFSKLKTKQI